MESISDLYCSLCTTSSRLFDAITLKALARLAASVVTLTAGVVVVLLLHGYHPFADDAAIYAAGIKHLLHPEWYASLDSPFLEAQGRFSIFEKAIALGVRFGGVRLEWVLLAVQVASIAATLAGAWRLAGRLFEARSARWFVLALTVASFSLPIAGTSLSVMDPYVTARSITTPLALFALSALVEESWNEAALLTVCALAFHPLMGASLAMFEMVWVCYTRPQRWRLLSVMGTIFVACLAVATAISRMQPFDPFYRRIVLGRPYLFLNLWEWYEYLGIAMPLLLCAWVWATPSATKKLRDLAATMAMAGAAVAIGCAIFVHPSGSMLLARLQLLRIFQVIYLAGIVMLGGWMASVYQEGTRLQGAKQWRAKAILVFPVLVAVGTSIGQRMTYEGRMNVELPTQSDPNGWHQAFLWIQGHTAPEAIFGADPDLMELPREGHEGFRASAERAILANNKDGGVVVLAPELAERWTSQEAAQANLATESDAARIDHLVPFRVDWVLLPPASATAFACPYQNDALKICRLPESSLTDLSRLQKTVEAEPSQTR